jgi:hypothetical protein
MMTTRDWILLSIFTVFVILAVWWLVKALRALVDRDRYR